MILPDLVFGRPEAAKGYQRYVHQKHILLYMPILIQDWCLLYAPETEPAVHN